jgi:penicillin-binding protein 2
MARSQRHTTPDDALAWTQIMVHGRSIEERRDVSERGIRLRLTIMSAAALLMFLLLGFRLFSVQVFSSQNFTELANGNRVRETINYAPRGKIYDRNGLVLADNSLSFQLSSTPFLLEENDAARERDIRAVAAILGEKPAEIRKTLDENGLEYVLPVVVADSLNHRQALLLEAKLPELKGFSVDIVPIREYMSEAAMAHVVGYSGRVSEADLDADQTGRLLPTDQIGKTGAELAFDQRLRGENGWVRVEVDALGRPIRVIDQRDPVPGEDIYLSIDFDVQKRMADAMKAQMKASKTSRSSGVAVDPVNGEVIAMVSLPAFDSNLFSGGISQKDFDRLNNDPDQPLFNKVISGGFTSGSIIKPLVASAALQERVVTPSTVIVDGGAITLPGGFTFLGWRPGGLGPMNVRSAIAWSSNIYFYTVGGGYGGIAGLGEERLTKYYRDFGLGEQTGIILPNESPGRVPDNEWKLENKGEPWYQGDSYNISIGQGDLLISPLHITMAEAAIANNGTLLTPQIERGAEPQVRRTISVDQSNLQIVREGMRQVLTGGTTCDCTFKDVPHKVAGKSGTAETDTPGGRRPHAWFTAYAPFHTSPDQKPDILATVLIEEGSGGSLYAAPVIAEAFDQFYSE